jgi:Protein phosphatase 2C
MPHGGWRVLAASVAGTAHVATGRGCDDAFAVDVSDDGVLVAAVADGAGSHSGTSAFGSYAACQAAVAAAKTALDQTALDQSEPKLEGVLRIAMGAAATTIERRAGELDMRPARLSTTLTLAVVVGGRAALAQIGDGVTVIRQQDEVAWVLAEPKLEYANLVTFLRADTVADVRVLIAEPVDAIALSTDGLRYKICNLAEGTPFVPFFDRLWTDLADKDLDEGQFADFLANVDDQTGDDKTLLMAVRGLGSCGFRSSAEPSPVKQAIAPESDDDATYDAVRHVGLSDFYVEHRSEAGSVDRLDAADPGDIMSNVQF